MAISISTSNNKTILEVKKSFSKFKKSIDAKMQTMAKTGALVMQATLASQVHRPPLTGNLEQHLTVKRVSTKFGNSYRIGNIAEMNKSKEQGGAPYWYVLNYGKRYDTGQIYLPPPVFGYFKGSEGKRVRANRFAGATNNFSQKFISSIDKKRAYWILPKYFREIPYITKAKEALDQLFKMKS